MAKRLSLEDKLSRLGEIEKTETETLSPEAIQELRKALGGANNFLVAKAAQVTATCGATDLIPRLVAAFDRFMAKPAKADKGCQAKTALIQALNRLGYEESTPFLQGIRRIQMEPVWGGQEDTAADLRSNSASGLVRLGYADVFFELTTLLVDQELQPRLMAVKALTHLGTEASELLLRLKVLAGDQDPQVLADCLTGLMTIDAVRSLSFVAQFLNATNFLIAEGAALALGGSREPAAFKILHDQWGQTLDPEFRKTLLLTIGLIRRDVSFDFLLEVIQDEHQDYAATAIEALSIYKNDAPSREKIQQAIAARDEAAISALARQFELL